MRPLIFLLIASIACAQPSHVIFDTDCAYFNDDGAALVMLLQRPKQVAIEGITVVPGNLWPVQGAEFMFHILRVMNRPNIPLFMGAYAPLVHTRAMALKEQRDFGPADYLGAFESDPPKSRAQLEKPFGGKFSGIAPARQHAVDFLIERIDRSPGHITVLALGPMTNIAIALRLRPDLALKIEKLVFMGGAVHVPGADHRAAEFNFWFDPEAAQVVLRSSIKTKIMFALDICNQAPIDKARFEEIAAAKTPITEIFRDDMANRYPGFAKNPSAVTYAWDCLAAAFLLDPKIVTRRETLYLDVDAAFGKNYGAVIPLDRTLAPDATPVEVMLTLDAPRFFALYKTLLTAPIHP
jgi:inosine-uridine nucleoside N-ribohydrolase